MAMGRPIRLAIVVSHPIQYYAPLYRRLAARGDVHLKVFYTWHAAETPVRDRGFGQDVAWDIPLTSGYEFERLRNTSRDPGTHRFFGLSNPELPGRVLDFRPDAVHVTGWAWHSHAALLRRLHASAVKTLFRGDSHLLDRPASRLHSLLKRAVLRRVFSWPDAFLYVGTANRAYYEAFGVSPARLFECPHSIEVGRFGSDVAERERQAASWRRELGIPDDAVVALFAGKFEPKKRPLDLIEALTSLDDRRIVLVMAGAGELEEEVRAAARRHPRRVHLLPFQNQSRMPVLYRLGDIFVLPSSHGETWGIAVNEAMACARPVIVSDRVGCAADLVDPGTGRVFPAGDLRALRDALVELASDRDRLVAMGRQAIARAGGFDISVTESRLVDCLHEILPG